MSNYSKTTDFAAKDALSTGNANKIVKGTEIDDEFSAIQTAVNSKADTNSPALTGSPTAPTACCCYRQHSTSYNSLCNKLLLVQQ